MARNKCIIIIIIITSVLIIGNICNVALNYAWMLGSFHFHRGPSMYGINYQKSVYMLVTLVLICSRIE